MRLTALKVLEILREESDKRHPLTLQKIASRLERVGKVIM